MLLFLKLINNLHILSYMKLSTSKFSPKIIVSGLSLLLLGFSIVAFEEPKISLDGYKIEEGFDLQIIAAEPNLKAPVSMDFDNKGRMWVVEMINYMPNLEGIGEEEPTGRISILEDLDHDGTIDHRKTFLDKLVLPRALAHVYGGLLYVDGPKLYFVEIKNDKPGKKTLVDPLYADGGNVEHSSNGLMMNIDNWIYNNLPQTAVSGASQKITLGGYTTTTTPLTYRQILCYQTKSLETDFTSLLWQKTKK
jgi:hypothetical protein